MGSNGPWAIGFSCHFIKWSDITLKLYVILKQPSDHNVPAKKVGYVWSCISWNTKCVWGPMDPKKSKVLFTPCNHCKTFFLFQHFKFTHMTISITCCNNQLIWSINTHFPKLSFNPMHKLQKIVPRDQSSDNGYVSVRSVD